MDIQQAKKNDEQYETYTISSVKDADDGYSLTFVDSPYQYWIPKKFNFIPKPGDVARIYGKLTGKEAAVKSTAGQDKGGNPIPSTIRYKETDNKQVRGLDIVREVKDTENGGTKRQRTELFYTAPEKKAAA